MSASLVGSEMCIRDRPRGAGRLPPDDDGKIDLATRLRILGDRVAPPHACLLYTSDAADDM
eukprot:3277090-Alexandrium_andersonii.AAC.1